MERAGQFLLEHLPNAFPQFSGSAAEDKSPEPGQAAGRRRRPTRSRIPEVREPNPAPLRCFPGCERLQDFPLIVEPATQMRGPRHFPWSQTNCGPNGEVWSWHLRGSNVAVFDRCEGFISSKIDSRLLRMLATADVPRPIATTTCAISAY